MRIGSSTLYNDFLVNQQNSMKYLQTTNTQIATGQKIQYGYQDVNTFVNTLRLDQENITLGQSIQASQGALQFSQNSDKALNDMTNSLTTFKTKLINAASGTNTETTRKALAQELTDLKNYMMNVSNTSINGQYLFSGSSFSVKPVADDGSYKGNGEKVKALVDSHVQYAYNVDGKSFFLGDNSDYHRSVTTNVPMKNKTLLNNMPPEDRYVKETDSVKDMLGNNGDGQYSYFYVSGKYSDGTAFKHELQVDVNAPISDLMSKIKNDFSGNVDVTLNGTGEIEIKDLRTGSSNMQFFMVAHDNTIPMTQASAGVNAGSTAITLNDATGIGAGDLLNIESIGQVKVASVAGNVVTLSAPLIASKDQLAGNLGVRKVLTASSIATAQAAVGATTIDLSDVSNIAVGDWIKVGDAGLYKVGAVPGANGALSVDISQPLTSGLSQNDIVTKYFHTPTDSEISNPYNASNAITTSSANTVTIGSVTGYSVGDKISTGDGGGGYTVMSIDPLTNMLTLNKTVTGGSVIINEDITKKLATNGSRVTEFVKSGSGPRYLGDVTGTNDYSDHRMFNLGIELRKKSDNQIAKSSDLLSSVIGSTPDAVSFGMSLTDGSTTPPTTTASTFNLSASSTVGDYVRQMQSALDAKFGQDKFQAGLDDQGRVSIQDLTISADQKFLSASNLIKMKLTAPQNTFASSNGIETDREYFTKNGNTAVGNMSQILKIGNSYAKPGDKLLDVAGTDTLVGKTMMLDITDLSGAKQMVPLTLDATASYFTYNSKKYLVMDATNPQGVTGADKMSYQQLMDVVSMVTSGRLPASTSVTGAAGGNTITLPSAITNYKVGDQISIGDNTTTYKISAIAGTTVTLSTNLTLAVPNPPSTNDLAVSSGDYNSAIISAQTSAHVSLDPKSRITIEDRLSSGSSTNMNFAIYDADANSSYSHKMTVKDNAMNFNSNKLLTIDDPKIDFFTQLQDAIDAVKSGKLRGDYSIGDSRNTGIQNAITSIDHVLEHTIRVHTNAGAISSAFQSSEDRVTTLRLNVKTVRSEFLDTDIAEAAANLNQRMLNYQAMLSTIGKISGLSLVNYIK
jgi:flagellin-like hook-associated protein FlgL